MKTAIVTIAIGAAYSARFRAHCEPGWSRYADRHSFKLIVMQMQLRRSLMPGECAALVRSAFDQGDFLHLAGLKGQRERVSDSSA
jgi:hypothetical protein